MKQQINFFRQEFLPKTDWLSLRMFAYYGAILLSVFVFYYNWQAEQIVVASAKEQSLTESVKTVDAEIKKISNVQAEKIDHVKLEKELVELNNIRNAKQKMLTEFGDEYEASFSGFAPYLLVFGQRAPRGLWLNQIEIRAENGAVWLAGQASSPGLITRFMQSLAKTQLFEQTQFNQFKIDSVVLGKEAEVPVIYSFELVSSNTTGRLEIFAQKE
ncbi:MAG: PilN domain-containing protein [Gammaproteobacteria bacterium]|nr:PilN domain-containing protein [Gammaproteobacteria bacterium]MDH5728270.1 PilN domain-containing protein [Gammaproteobacteria bacterium]